MGLTEMIFRARLRQLKVKMGAAKQIEYGIATRTFLVPMHEQPMFRMIGLFEGGRDDDKNGRSHI